MGVRALIVDEFEESSFLLEWEQIREGIYPEHHGDTEQLHWHFGVGFHTHPDDPYYKYLHKEFDPLKVFFGFIDDPGFGVPHIPPDLVWKELWWEVEGLWRAERNIPWERVLTEPEWEQVGKEYTKELNRIKTFKRWPRIKPEGADPELWGKRSPAYERWLRKQPPPKPGLRSLPDEFPLDPRRSVPKIKPGPGMLTTFLKMGLYFGSAIGGYAWAGALEREMYLPDPRTRAVEFGVGEDRMLTVRPDIVFEGGGELDPIVKELLLEAFLMGVGTVSGGYAEMGERAVTQLSPERRDTLGALVRTWVEKTGKSPFFLYGAVHYGDGYIEIRGFEVYLLRYSPQFNVITVVIVPGAMMFGG